MLKIAVVDDEIVFVPIDLAQQLFDYSPTEVSSVEIKVRNGNQIDKLESTIQTILGDSFAVQNRYEQQADFYRILQIEKWITFLILAFILLIATCNIIGSLSMLMINKQQDIALFFNLGADNKIVQFLFLLEGWMISVYGALVGLAVGVVLCLIQQYVGVIKMGEGFVVENYPVALQLGDVFLVFFTVIILGLRNKSTKPKYLYNNNIRREAKNVNAYLLDSADIIIVPRNKSISGFPSLPKGNMPYDGGNLILTDFEKNELLIKYPKSEKFFKKLYGASELMDGANRWCLWIRANDLEEAKSFDFIKERIEKVKQMRLSSSDAGAHKLALTPYRFREINETKISSIAIPLTTSERREYIPLCIIDSTYIGTNALSILYDVEPYYFGILHSKMHMVWVDAVGGKLETRYRYSAKLCYNTFPFPEISEKQKLTINEYVFAILDERAKYPEKTMAWLYNPETMPKGLKEAHKNLDRAIEEIYRMGNPFTSDAERLEHLFKRYDEMTKKDTLFAKQKKTRKKKTD